jgi:hypothetical protein
VYQAGASFSSNQHQQQNHDEIVMRKVRERIHDFHFLSLLYQQVCGESRK